MDLGGIIDVGVDVGEDGEVWHGVQDVLVTILYYQPTVGSAPADQELAIGLAVENRPQSARGWESEITMKKRRTKNRGRPLSRMKVEKGKIPSPWNGLSAIAPVRPISWYHEFLPDFLWLVLLMQQHLRTRTFRAFQSMFEVLHEHAPDEGQSAILLTHHSLAEMDEPLFEKLLEPLLSDETLAESLRPLATLADLPGIERWKAKLGPPSADSAAVVEAAVKYAAPQDSRAATDIAFIGLINLISQGKIAFNSGIVDADEINRYAYDPDAAPHVASMVRAMRNSILVEDRNNSGHDDAWTKSFYGWGRENTDCRGVYVRSGDDDSEYASVATSIMATIGEIRRACAERLTTDFRRSGPDERREVLASLGLYSCDIAISAGISGSASHAQGAILIRSLAEINILISYISSNNDAASLYREYGAGRAALLSAKSDEAGASANYLFVEELSAVANERRAAIFIDMPINGFYKKSIRETAIECGAKEVYDAYYDIGSMYGHAEWGGVATSSVQMCMNPLHLGHYVPSERMFATEMLKDVSWLINRIADQLGVPAPEGADPIKA